MLPFANLGGDKENDYFSDGLAEEIINALTGLPGLHVVARTSAFAFRGKEMDVREIAAKLSVSHVLEGSVRTAGKRLRVTAQLINAADGYHLWSERFDREMEDVFAIQDEISEAIADKLPLRLAVKAQPVKRHTQNMDAYRAYLEGRHHHQKLTADELNKAEECFERAIVHDPDYALGYAGVADCHYARAVFGFAIPRVSLAKSKAMVQHALSLDDSLAEAHATLGALLAMIDFDWDGAEEEFRLALSLKPESSLVRFRYSWFVLVPQRRFDESLRELDRAFDQDPLSVLCGWAKACTYLFAGRYQEAAEESRKTISFDPSIFLAYWMLAGALAKLGRLDEALLAVDQVGRLTGEIPPVIAFRGVVLAVAGRTEEARDIAEKLAGMAKETFVSADALAELYLALEDLDSAFEWAERAVQERSFRIVNIPMTSRSDAVRSDPRYHALLRRMNLNPEEHA